MMGWRQMAKEDKREKERWGGSPQCCQCGEHVGSGGCLKAPEFYCNESGSSRRPDSSDIPVHLTTNLEPGIQGSWEEHCARGGWWLKAKKGGVTASHWGDLNLLWRHDITLLHTTASTIPPNLNIAKYGWKARHLWSLISTYTLALAGFAALSISDCGRISGRHGSRGQEGFISLSRTGAVLGCSHPAAYNPSWDHALVAVAYTKTVEYSSIYGTPLLYHTIHDVHPVQLVKLVTFL
ncbi:hypothetical protein K438DRAFT_2131724 [Mycena galopus ATCC 62051]|nr:hypothetical protein K438DRAFT_2131724 [Mycena galopus ATCC 62051]